MKRVVGCFLLDKAPMEGTHSVIGDLQSLFGPVIEREKMILVSREESPYFGDAVLTFAGALIELRLISGRGLPFVELRARHDPTEWFELSLVQMLLTGNDTLDGAPIQALAHFLNGHLDAVRRALENRQWPLTRRQLHALEKKRVTRRLGPGHSRE